MGLIPKLRTCKNGHEYPVSPVSLDPIVDLCPYCVRLSAQQAVQTYIDSAKEKKNDVT